MIKSTACYLSLPITVQAGLHLRKTVGCAVRTRTGSPTDDSRCARRTLRLLRLNLSYGYAFRSRAALTNTTVTQVKNAG